MAASRSGEVLEPYVPRLAVSWLRETPDAIWRAVDGSLAFVDISGFTALTERLARKGKVGAEEMSDILNVTFADLLGVAFREGAGLVKWGGDAVLLLLQGDDHALRAARAAYGMRARLKSIGRIGRGRGSIELRMSVGIHSGTFHFFLVGDPALHRELLISGPAASRTAEVEALAAADEIGLSTQTAALLDQALLGGPLGDGFLLDGCPALPELGSIPRPPLDGLDLAPLIPAAIRTHLLSKHGEAEHRRIAVAFVQFSGTDDLLHHEGAEALAAALDECIRNVQRATAKYGVTFFETDINRDGGKIMLTAGAPASADHNEERMLLATTEIARRSGQLPLRVGVNAGEVFSCDFGPPFRRTFSVKGDAINLAARLLGKAEPGQVVATMTILEKSATTFETEPLDPFHVKGKAAAISAARVGRPLAPDAGSAAGPERASFVGREPELLVLHETLTAACDGQGHLVHVTGPAGIGKTRLVTEFVRDGEVRALVTRCDDYETATPYWPFRTLLRDVLDVTHDADDGTVVTALLRHARRSAPHLEPWLPLVAEVMDVAMGTTTEVDALVEEFRKARREDVTTAFLVAVLDSPSVVIIDDAHLMDDASTDLLEKLARGLAGRSLLLVVVRRELDQGFQPSQDYPVVTVHPAPLEHAAATRLVELETAEDAVSAHDVTAIVARAQGHPLFLRGLIVALRSGRRADALPETVEALITSQIDQLPPDERALLRFASVLGTTFRQADLRALLEGQPLPRSRNSLRRLAYFIHPVGHGVYRFENQLLRDTAYEGLPYRLRRQLHGRAGEQLELTAPDVGDVAEVLSLHFLHAQRRDKAWHYSRLGGERAAEKHAYVEAEALYARAVAAARGLHHVNNADKASAFVALGDARHELGRTDEAIAAYTAARARLREDTVGTARVLRREASTYRVVGDYGRARRRVQRATRILDQRDDAASRVLLSQLEVVMAGVCMMQGHPGEALAWSQAAQSHAAGAGDIGAEADAAAMVFSQLVALGRPDRAPGETALRLYKALGDSKHQATALSNLAVLSWLEGRGGESLAMFRQAHELSRLSGDTYSQGLTAANIGDVLVLLGHMDEAEEVLRRCLPGLRAARMTSFLAVAQRSLGLALVGQGHCEEGLTILDTARAQQQSLGELDEIVLTDAGRAIAHLAAGNPAEAAALCRAALRDCATLDADHAVPQVLRVLGAALVDLGKDEEAAEVLDEARRRAETDAPIERGFVLTELGQLATRRGDKAAARRLTEDARAAFVTLGFLGNERYPRP